MSQTKAQLIEGTSSQDVTFDDATVNSLNGGPLAGTRNLIINGDMQVAQRGTSFTSQTIAHYCTDQFLVSISSLGTWTSEQSTDAPDGFGASLKVTCTTADASPAASAYTLIIQRIEAQNLQHLKYGRSSAEALTLSFYVKSNKTGSASFDCRQDDSDRMFSTSYTINAADTWEYKTIAIPADVAGQIDNDNGRGLILDWWLNSGSNFSGGSYQTTWASQVQANRNVSNLGIGGATSDYLAITGVQLEAGTVATPFERRSYGQELSLCQRYTEVATLALVSHVLTTNSSNYAHFFYRATKRAAPNYSILNGAWLGFTPAIDILETNMARWTSGSGAFYSNQSVTVMFSADL